MKLIEEIIETKKSFDVSNAGDCINIMETVEVFKSIWHW